MAIAFDNAATAITFVNTANPSGSYTVGTITNGLLLAAIESDADVVTAATYNAVSMSLMSKLTIPSGRVIYLYGLLNPATGSNTLQLTSTATHFTAANCASYSGVLQSGLPDNVVTNTSVISPITATLTPVASGCWVMAMACNEGNTSSAGTATTGRIVGSSAEQSYMTMVDSNGTVSGSTTMTVNYTVGAVSYGMVMISVAPAGGGAATTPSRSRQLIGIGK